MYRWPMLLIIAVAALPRLLAQGQMKSSPATFETGATLVLVPVTVMDRRGALVNGLRADSFNVTEDRVSQEIFSFGEQDVPASIGVILDMSGSMKGTLTQARAGLRSFLGAANPEDEAFLYSVSSRPSRRAALTQDLDSLEGTLLFAEAMGSTALIDTVYRSLDEMRSAHCPRKALLIISDGMDNHSRYTRAELMERALESDIQIYTIGLDNTPAYAKPIQLSEARQGLLLLEELAVRTGGLDFVVRNAEGVNRTAAIISRAIRNEYTIGYMPGDTGRDGKWHSIQVKVALPGSKVYARSGYYSQ